ncbi:12215_t:CDS:2 [Funneliformis caledonium]|uniref:12215_t:CDS:1 n=1 Tax=Funneliformis caledonium TaxID=1117310 RepID=A0A9N9FL52_9GLOM|nr:12215_t:CDS:2 [Funneliformis caledonium]
MAVNSKKYSENKEQLVHKRCCTMLLARMMNIMILKLKLGRF